MRDLGFELRILKKLNTQNIFDGYKLFLPQDSLEMLSQVLGVHHRRLVLTRIHFIVLGLNAYDLKVQTFWNSFDFGFCFDFLVSVWVMVICIVFESGSVGILVCDCVFGSQI